MMSDKAVIDLGLYHYDPEADPAEDPHGSDRMWPDWNRSRRLMVRWWRPALVLAVVVGLLGGAAVPGAPLLVLVWTVPAAATHQVATAGGVLYAAGHTGEEWAIRAYRLADGAPLWETAVENPGDWAELTVADGVPLVVAPRPGSIEAVTAYHPDSGEAIWSGRGWPRAIHAGQVLLTRQVPTAWPADDGTLPGDGAHAYQGTMVDLRTGDVAWTRRFPPGEEVLGREASVPHLLTLSADGRLTRYDPATGEVLASAQTPAGSEEGTLLGTVIRAMVGEASVSVLPVAVANGHVEPAQVVLGEPEALTGYDPVTLARRWRLELPGRAWATPCGELVCASGDGELDGIDPVTGAVRWSLPCQGGDSGVRVTCFIRPITVVGGHLLTQRVSLAGEELASAVLAVDIATGQVAAQLAGWSPAAELPPDQWLVGWEDPRWPEAEPGPSWLVRWGGDPPHFQLRGPVDAQWCQPAGEHLVCVPAEPGDLQVWQIR